MRRPTPCTRTPRTRTEPARRTSAVATAVASAVAPALTAIVLFGCTAPPREPVPDLVLHGGAVVTLDDDLGVPEAIAVAGGVVQAVGSSDEILALAGPDTRLVDLQGRTVVPGLTDNHFHSIGGGPGVDLSRVRTLADVGAAIAERATTTAPGDVIVTNSDWHEGQLAEQRLPLRDDLDRAAPDRAVVVVRGGHEYILNSVALARWGIDLSTPVPAGGRIGRYPDGRLNGELVDRAKDLVALTPPANRPDPEETWLRTQETLNALGVTSVRIPGGSAEQYRMLRDLEEQGKLTLRIEYLFRPRGVGPDGIDAAVAAWGVGPDDKTELIQVGGVKLGVDGGFEGGWMRDPYEEPWGEGRSFQGLQTMATEDFIGVVQRLNALGWRVATHAVGDAAIDLVLDAYARADAERSIRERRWTVEHGFIPRADHYRRLRELGLTVTAQNHLYVAAPSLVSYWGPERAARTTPVGEYVAEGIPVSLGTDSPVIPYNPFWVLYHFATRGTISAGVMGDSFAVDRMDALRVMATGYAHQTFAEDIQGTLAPGMRADLAVLDRDYRTVPDEDIQDLHAVMTVAGGRVVYERD